MTFLRSIKQDLLKTAAITATASLLVSAAACAAPETASSVTASSVTASSVAPAQKMNAQIQPQTKAQKTSTAVQSASMAQTEKQDKSTTMTSKPSSADSLTLQANRLFETYVKDAGSDGLARFDYAALKASPKDQKVLNAYIDSLAAQNPATLDEKAELAAWANLYNALTVKVVVDNYPVKSIKDIKSGFLASGPWKKKMVTVAGTKMSLDDIEHGTMRKKYPSPLIHYMVNCASVGCPNLKDGLWTRESFDVDREAAARAFINSPRGAKVTPDGLVVSSIYDWYQEDFGGSKEGVLAHLSKYATGELKTALDNGAQIKSYDYDWSLNKT